METNMIKFERSQFVNLYRQAARSIHECLPFGMKDEFSIDIITEILELEDEFLNKMKALEKIGENAVNTSTHKDMLCHITNILNSRQIFPTYSDIERVLGNKNSQSFSLGTWNKKVA